MENKLTVRIEKAPMIHGHRGWNWVLFLGCREVGAGWSAGKKTEARRDAMLRAEEMGLVNL
jgi:hypothetical protein